jgi:hypothetical protein
MQKTDMTKSDWVFILEAKDDVTVKLKVQDNR